MGMLFGGGGAKAPPPPPAPVPMPDLADPALLAAQKRVFQKASAQSGRQSTLLSGNSDDYSGTKLGSA